MPEIFITPPSSLDDRGAWEGYLRRMEGLTQEQDPYGTNRRGAAFYRRAEIVGVRAAAKEMREARRA